MIFPLTAILKLGAIKALLIPTLLATLFIKKMVILTVMALPSLLSVLKICKVPGQGIGLFHAPTVYHAPATIIDEDGTDHSSYSGLQAAHYSGKDWGTYQRKYTG